MTTAAKPAVELRGDPRVARAGLIDQLEQAFAQSFAVIDLRSGQLQRVASDWPRVDVYPWLPLCEAVARTGAVEPLCDHAPLLMIAVPLGEAEGGPPLVALTVLKTEPSPTPADVESAASALGVDAKRLVAWCEERQHWPPYAALRLAESLLRSHKAATDAAACRQQLSEVSAQLLATFEELHLLHQLTEGLSLGRSVIELTEQSVHRLAGVISSDCVIARLEVEGKTHVIGSGSRTPISEDELESFFDSLGPQATRRCVTLNRDRTSSPTWAFPAAREVVCAPIISSGQTVGQVAAINYRATDASTNFGFCSVEASLLSSVATLIGVHSSNRSLFRDKSELFSGAVEALSAAIDAKDPYTCGHSDRVARIAVRLARELDCDEADLNTVYLAGLLHDVGKIGVDDEILSKPGELTDEEFEHVKQHPVLGEEILRGVPALSHVLPLVRHHHEAWNGGGYPDGLVGEECPLLARVLTVADAIDAMGSSRPYRQGMPPEQIEEILRDGAAKQWDPDVVRAYFAASEDVRQIAEVERQPLDLDVGTWATLPKPASADA